MFGRKHGHHRHGPWRHEEREERHEEREERHVRHGGPFGHEHGAWFGPRGGRGGRGPHWRGGPFGGDPFGEDGGRQRHRRGDIKFWLLELIAEQPRHGYDLIKALEERYGGFYRPSPGSVYPTLQLLEDEGRLTSETVDGKRVYTITDAGRELLAERGKERGGPHGHRMHGRLPELDELRQGTMALADSVLQVARHGSPDQARGAVQILERARREIYALLAQDQPEQPE